MAIMGTILNFYLFFWDFIANFPHVMTVFLVMVKGSHSLFVELGLCNLSLEFSLTHVVVAESSFG